MKNIGFLNMIEIFAHIYILNLEGYTDAKDKGIQLLYDNIKKQGP